MKIQSNSTNQPLPATARPSPRTTTSVDRAGGPVVQSNNASTRVELSPRARELAAARRAADAAPDVRADVVANARQRIANGQYQVDPEQIARRLIDRTA